MPEIGEEIVGAYLKECLHCEFVEYNYDLGFKQAECDVLGAALGENVIYLCEVATHTRGLLYVNPSTKRPATYERLMKKFASDIRFAREKFPKFRHQLMFWSPIVRASRNSAKYDASSELKKLVEDFQREKGERIDLVVNRDYADKLTSLREVARHKGSDSPFSIVRFLQIDEILRKHLGRI